MIFYSGLISAESYNYSFHWFTIPVAELIIDYPEEKEKGISSFNLRTDGPLKIYRNYSSTTIITNEDNRDESSWTYYLTGVDRGEREEKYIHYSQKTVPKIEVFIDDQGVSPLNIDPQLDRGSIDPVSTLLMTIKQLSSQQTCSGDYFIMDGKRRYIVSVALHSTNTITLNEEIGQYETLYNCIFTLKKEIKNEKRWPFNERERSMIIQFSSKLSYHPKNFNMMTPIGRIKGKISN